MNDVVIKVKNLSKLYRLGELHKQTNSFRERVTNAFSRIAHSAKRKASNPMPSSSDNAIWALRDVSFEIKRGEIVGIIGRNGAGKTTLLKILSRITTPTEGTALINGRVGSLLEVGTGFHPELTGRENIFLNGAILGMTKAEIKHKFDQIVDFAEIEKFIDTPVKRYSSGMYVRLAFAVAAHLEPEILLVDEVLAVGDTEFQKKCLGKMKDIGGQGRTVLFVSHNMGAIRTLTQHCIYLEQGHIVDQGKTQIVVEQYLTKTLNKKETTPLGLDFYRRDSRSMSPVRFLKISVNDYQNDMAEIYIGQTLIIHMTLESQHRIRGSNIAINIKNKQGVIVTTILALDSKISVDLEPGITTLACKIEGLNLLPGIYMIDVGINQTVTTTAWDVILDYPGFSVLNSGEDMITYRLDRPGVVLCNKTSWHVYRSEELTK